MVIVAEVIVWPQHLLARGSSYLFEIQKAASAKVLPIVDAQEQGDYTFVSLKEGTECPAKNRSNFQKIKAESAGKNPADYFVMCKFTVRIL